MHKFITLLITVVLVVSCDSKQVFDEYKNIPFNWKQKDTVAFKFMAPDTISNYNLYVNIRNNSSYKFSNLFLIVNLNYPNNKTIVDTLEYEMATTKGEWLGTGFSETKENKLWYKEQIKFKQEGEYSIEITHANRENGVINGISELKGITDVGFRIEKNTNEKKAL
jgi:gliding motility-associated lipoprotein GldH